MKGEFSLIISRFHQYDSGALLAEKEGEHRSTAGAMQTGQGWLRSDIAGSSGAEH